MENLLLCSRTLYDKDLLDKTREIEEIRKENEELKEKVKKMQFNICCHNYADECSQRYYPWVNGYCEENNPIPF